MVSNKITSSLLLILVSVMSSFSFAETKLDATVDRSKIYEMDTLNLTIQGEVDVDFSFGGLMNFGLSQTETPKIEGLEKDFEILDTQQSYNMQSINGESKAQVLWRYTLAPKNSGVLEIPVAEYKGGKTKPIQVTVIEGTAPKNASEPPAIFLEVETDKQTAYVQEQIVYTLRLYTQGLINGELSEPNSTDAIIEPFGEQKKYYRMAFNQRYEVVERKYLIFPQKSGSLTIEKQTFQGVSLKQGRRTRLKDMSESIELNIKPPAKSFSGKNWLPATSLFLNEQWQGDPDKLKVGDSITRKLELSALGLLGSALTPIKMKESPLYKLYIDKPSTESVQHESGAQAKRSDSFAIVAIKDGSVQLNEIRIPWWDTVNDVERVAIIPARTLNIAINPDIPTQNNTTEKPNQMAHEVHETEQANSADVPIDLNETEEGTTAPTNQSHLWQTFSGLLFVLWVVTIIYFVRKQSVLQAKLLAIPLPKQAVTSNENARFIAALNAVKQDDKRMTQTILNWLSCYQEDHQKNLNSLQDIKLISQTIYDLLSAYEASNYSKNQTSTYNKATLINAIKEFRDQNKPFLAYESSSQKKQNSYISTHKLEPFYQA